MSGNCSQERRSAKFGHCVDSPSQPPDQAGARRSASRTAFMLAAIFFASLIVRLIYLVDSSDNPTFMMPTNDSLSYHTFATYLAEKGEVPPNFFFQPYLYPFLLSQLYKVVGAAIWPAKIIQAIGGALTCALTALLGRNLFGIRAGWLAGLITALLGPLIFFETELLATGLAAFFGIVLPLTMLWLHDRPRNLPAWGILGVCGVLATLARPTFLPVYVFGAGWLLYRTALYTIRRRALWTGSALLATTAGFAAIALPVAHAVYRYDGEYTILPSSGALNLYLGNHPNQDFAIAIRPGYEWETLLFEPTRVNPAVRTNRQAQAYWRTQLMNNVRQHPGAILAGLARKTWLLFATREIPRTLDEYVFRRWSWVLSALVWRVGPVGFPMAVVLPLALTGLVASWRRIPAILKWYLLFFSISTVLVFAAARYRTPLFPMLAILAAGGVEWYAATLRNRRYRHMLAGVVGGTILIAATSPPWRLTAEQNNYEAEMHLFLGTHPAVATQNNPEEYVSAHLESASDLDPANSEVHYQLAMALLRQQRFSQAEVEVRQTLQLASQHAGAHVILGALCGQTGRPTEAIDHFSQAVAERPEKTDWSLILARRLLDARRREEGIATLLQYVRYERLSSDSLRQAASMLTSASGMTQPQCSAALIQFIEQADALSNGGNLDVLQLLWTSYMRAGRHTDALDALNRTVELANRQGNVRLAESLSPQVDRLSHLLQK